MKIGVFTGFGLLFTGLKLASVIDWSWWWVLSPFWIGFVWYAFWIFVLAVLQAIAEG